MDNDRMRPVYESGTSGVISVVVPVYNNQPTLEETCRQIVEIHGSGFPDLKLEMIFVNDGSTDKSWEELLRLQGIHEDQIVLLNLSRNFGQLGALMAGLDHASGDAAICISADLQDPIHLMAKMVAYWKSNTEIVICYREKRTDGLLPHIYSTIVYSIVRIYYADLPKGGFDYWLTSRRVYELLRSFKGRNIFLQGYCRRWASAGHSFPILGHPEKPVGPAIRLPRNSSSRSISCLRLISQFVSCRFLES
jgi:polyisoprenyl-phosphate glycosyltransferase